MNVSRKMKGKTMGIALKLDYEFELNGETFAKIGADFGETEKETDIPAINADTKNLEKDAICDAFDLTLDEYDAERYKNVYFRYVEVRA